MKQINKILASCCFLFPVSCLLLLISLFLTSCTFHKVSNENIIRLGFMPNVTHATALVGIEKNIFQEELGDVRFKPIHFVVGNSIIDAFITGQIDVAYVGPGPYLNAIYRKVPIKLLANACNGGSLIVGAYCNTPLRENMRIAIPQYGNTQDLILRSYLEKNNLLNKTKIISIPPQDTGTAFFTMSIDAACLPEPWGTILIEKHICNLIRNEKNILNDGNYPVTVLVVNDDFYSKHPEVIKKIIVAHKKASAFINANPKEAIKIVRAAVSRISNKQIDEDIISKSFSRCSFKDEIDFKMLKDFQTIGIKAGYYRKGFKN